MAQGGLPVRASRPLRRPRSWAGRAPIPLAGLLGACGGRYGAPEPASRQGSEILGLWQILFWAGAGIGIVVSGLILYALVHYRRREGGIAAPFREHVPIEVAYTVIPLVIVAVLFGFTYATQRDVTALSERPDVRIEVTGFQWGWRFHYLAEGVTVVGTADDPPTMVLPLDGTAQLILRSPDVIHSFYVPEFLVKRDAIPGVDNRIDVTPTRAGRFGGLCAEFCGLDHGRMTFVVEVVTRAELAPRLAELEQEQERDGPPDPDSPEGRQDDVSRQASPRPPAVTVR